MTRFPLSVAFFLASSAIAQCTITAPGTQVAPTPVDSWTTIQSIGFSFPFCGGNYTGFYITDHGVIALTNGGTPVVPPGASFVWNPYTTSLTANSPMITPYWSDHTSGTLNTGTMWVDSSATHCTVTWRDMQTFMDQTPPFTIQATLYPSGQIVFCLDSRVNNSGSTYGALNAIMGVSPGVGGTLGPAIDISTSPVTANNVAFEEWVTTLASTPNPLFDVANSTIRWIPTNPSWVVIENVLACAANNVFGTGCDNLALSASLPVLGTNWTLTTNGVSPVSPIAILFFGTSELNPGVPLPAIGFPAPGCSVYVNGLVTNLSAPNVAGTATLSIPLPLNAALKNATLTVQSLGLTLSNPASLATSNGLTGDLGY
jgi:hypothetical protein